MTEGPSATSFLAAALCLVLALAVLWRDRRGLSGRVLAAGLLALGAEAYLAGVASRTVEPFAYLLVQKRRMLATALVPGLWLAFSLAFARSDHEDALRRWRVILALALAVPMGLVLLFPEALFRGVGRSSPTQFTLPLGWAGYVFEVLFLGVSALTLRNLERTLRASSGSMRWFVKFMVLGVGCVFAARIYTGSQTLLYLTLDEGLEAVNAGALIVGGLFMGVSLLRARLKDADVYLSPAALTSSFVVLAVGIYLVVAGLLARFVRSFGSVESLPAATLVAFLAMVALTVLLLSDEVRQKTRRLVSRHFRRPLYDYREVWTGFTERTASSVRASDLARATCRFVSETLRIPSVTLWLREEGEGVGFGASTVYAEARVKDILPRYARLLARPDLKREAMDLPVPGEPPAPSEEAAADARHAVVLRSGEEVLGLLVLGERGTKEPLSQEDRDLLELLATQAAAGLQGLRLGKRLLRAREMEAFQSLSAFFVHDLKNLASKLSLTMRNLSAHFDDPAFREDLLGVMTHSVAKINDMCARLSPLSRRLDLKRSRVELGDLVREVLAGLEPSLGVEVVATAEGPALEVDVDREEIQKVVTNLVLNANEAVKEGEGRIRVAIVRHADAAAVVVSDNGGGMTPEFLAHSLFQPFQTTKAGGLGIGLFHSRKIVEAHGGRIEVESREGCGSTFRVLLPLSAALVRPAGVERAEAGR